MTHAAASITDVGLSPPGPPRPATDPRRVLQLVLASLWLLDALLQLQPYMFSRAFGTEMLAGSSTGTPVGVAHSIRWVGLTVGHHPVAANSAFALVQLVLALGIAWRPTVKAALALSVVWAACVWWFGEGLGGLFASSASPATGTPGAVLLYAVAAVVLWPAERAGDNPPSVAARDLGARPARMVWVALWGALACLTALEAFPAHHGLDRSVAAMAVGEPSWLARLDHDVAGALAHSGTAVDVVLVVLLAAVAAGTLSTPAVARAAVGAAVVLALVIWVVGENLGGVLSGAGTDPNTGPLLVLVALCYWPRHAGPSPAPLTVVGAAA